MSRLIVMDTGPIISLVMNNLLQYLRPLRDRFEGDFVITPAVRKELIDRPLDGKRFAFEALRVMRHIREGTIQVMDAPILKSETEKLMLLANQSFKAKGQWIKIVHYAEMEAMALALHQGAEAIVIDERTARMLLENPESVKVRLGKKLHTHITVNTDNLEQFKEKTKGLKVLRSVELVMAAYETGMLSKYLPERDNASDILLNSVLWGLKFSGCAISNDELNRVEKIIKQG